jgi:hypothetical protein
MKNQSFFVYLLLFVSLCGCGCRDRNEAVNSLIEAGSIEVGDARHLKEDFDRAFEQLASLDDAPCLPNSPGFEKLVNTADRLDKWIRNRTSGTDWKPDESLTQIEKSARNVSGEAKQVVQSLNLLQGKEVLDDASKPITPSETLRTERQNITEALTRLKTELQSLVKLGGLTGTEAYSQLIGELQKKFDALEKIPNLNATSVRSFAKQLENETAEFVDMSTMLEHYALQLRTEGLFVQTSDVEYLKQSTWTNSLSNWSRGNKQSLLDRVTNLFDWTVCNIELRNEIVPVSSNQSIEMPQPFPWQTLLLGYGTMLDRAAVFIELLRQQRIDAVLLSVPNSEIPEESSSAARLFWGVGVLLDGEVYIYLPAFGMPLPGKEGAKIGEDGSLSFPQIATLSQVLQDDSLLRQLDLSETQRFPITAEMLKKTTAHLFVTPESASKRMKVIETELTGDQSMVLYTDVQELRRRFGEVPGVSDVKLWDYPFRTVFEQLYRQSVTTEFMSVFLIPSPKRQNFPLWSGRILYFKGRVSGQESAITNYQDARVPDRELVEYRQNPQFRNNPLAAIQIQLVTTNASYWLGLASFEVNSIPAAKDFLTGIRSSSLNAWSEGTEYILGRIAEREKRYTDAVKHYERTASTPAGLGNAVRAQWLPH